MKPGGLFDSSVWIEWLTRGKRHVACQKAMDSFANVGVPAVVVFEVCRKVTAKVSDDEALRVAAWLRTFGILPLTDEIALTAVDLSLAHNLGMADSIVLAHAYREAAHLCTLDNDFSSLRNVTVIRS